LEGILEREWASAVVYQDDLGTDDWIVAAMDERSLGIALTVFGGPRARERALEYAAEKYSSYQLLTMSYHQ